MRKGSLLAPLLALLLMACGASEQRVERPMGEVYATLANLPRDTDAMPLATQFPGTRYWVEQDGVRVVWHFAQNGQEYGRFVAALAEDGAAATRVTTSFEPAETDADLSFLREIAQIAGEASVAAALEQRPVDMAAVRQSITDHAASNPMAAQVATIETISDRMDEMAPPDPCESDDRETRERCLNMEHLRGKGSQNFR